MNHKFTVLLSFVLVFAVSAPSILAAEGYKGPLSFAVPKDGSKIYIAHFDANEIAVFNVAENKIAQTIPVGKEPDGIVLSADEKTLYVAVGAEKGLVQAIDIGAGKVVREAAAGHTPIASAVTPDGKKLFVCNRFNADVAEYDLPDLKLVRRVKVIREPRGAVVTKDGKTVYVANAIPNNVANIPENPDALIDVAAEISAIDVATGTVKNIRLPNGSGSIHGICLSPDGRYVYVTEILARFQMPTTQLERGWMNTNGISIIDTTQLEGKRAGFVNTVLIDDVDLGAANPWGITTSADGKQIFIAVAGTSELIVIDAEAMHKKLASILQDDPDTAAGYAGGSSASAKASDVPNDLAFLVGMKKRVRLEGKGARPVTAIGNNVYVGMYYSDTLQKIDLSVPGNLKGTEIAVGPKPDLAAGRRGEIYWNDATLCFQYWQSCASCHPDARMDAYNWDLLNDGLGNPKNAKSLLYSLKTTPSMWEAVRDNPELDKKEKRKVWITAEEGLQCVRTGFTKILFSLADEVKCKDIDAYIDTMQPVPSPRLVDGKLSEKAERGKKIFEDEKIGCIKCHPGPLFTDLQLHDVNTKCYYDRKGSFDTPTLVETWRTAPYLHDGRYVEMKDLFKKGKHGDVEGDVESLSDEQIDDLVEYVLSL